MTSDSSLPRRRPAGYQITSVVLEIVAGKRLAELIEREVQLPAPPATNLNEMQLAEFVRSLVQHARRALVLLERNESERARSSYRQPRYERVSIKVLSGGRLIGRVNGASQVFDARGAMTSPGDLAHPAGPLQRRNGLDGGPSSGRKKE